MLTYLVYGLLGAGGETFNLAFFGDDRGDIEADKKKQEYIVSFDSLWKLYGFVSFLLFVS